MCSFLGKFTLYDALSFIFWSVVAILGCVALYYILYYVVWQGIILPILKFIAAVIGGILLLMSLGDGCSNTSCPFYPKHNCDIRVQEYGGWRVVNSMKNGIGIE